MYFIYISLFSLTCMFAFPDEIWELQRQSSNFPAIRIDHFPVRSIVGLKFNYSKLISDYCFHEITSFLRCLYCFNLSAKYVTNSEKHLTVSDICHRV